MTDRAPSAFALTVAREIAAVLFRERRAGQEFVVGMEHNAVASIVDKHVGELLAALKPLCNTLHDCETASECAVLIARGDAVSCAQIVRAKAAIAKAEVR